MATQTIEMEPIQLPAPVASKSLDANFPPRCDGMLVDECQSPPPGSFSTKALPRWNESRESVIRIIATFFTFFVMGANDAAYGPLLPHV